VYISTYLKLSYKKAVEGTKRKEEKRKKPELMEIPARAIPQTGYLYLYLYGRYLYVGI
jgi:hypothetical protein